MKNKPQKEYSLRSFFESVSSTSAAHSSAERGGNCRVFLFKLCLCQSLLKCSLYCLASPTTASHVVHCFRSLVGSLTNVGFCILSVNCWTTSVDVEVSWLDDDTSSA
ncbi:hypothetical protein HanIR_Chr04g0169231 [Helianthus annuus]|nr:hypothetical protein HanIR_Chr04g0169231 [Helianthus annuus]